MTQSFPILRASFSTFEYHNLLRGGWIEKTSSLENQSRKASKNKTCMMMLKSWFMFCFKPLVVRRPLLVCVKVSRTQGQLGDGCDSTFCFSSAPVDFFSTTSNWVVLLLPTLHSLQDSFLPLLRCCCAAAAAAAVQRFCVFFLPSFLSEVAACWQDETLPSHSFSHQ